MTKFFASSILAHSLAALILWAATLPNASTRSVTPPQRPGSFWVETSFQKTRAAPKNARAKTIATPARAQNTSNASASAIGSSNTEYMLQVRSRVLSALNDSWSSLRKPGLSGRVVLKVVLNELGQTERTEIIQSSGFAQLDLLATDAAKQASPFPQPGPKLRELGPFGVVVPIEFGSKIQ
jgi:TonB family protein